MSVSLGQEPVVGPDLALRSPHCPSCPPRRSRPRALLPLDGRLGRCRSCGDSFVTGRDLSWRPGCGGSRSTDAAVQAEHAARHGPPENSPAAWGACQRGRKSWDTHVFAVLQHLGGRTGGDVASRLPPRWWRCSSPRLLGREIFRNLPVLPTCPPEAHIGSGCGLSPGSLGKGARVRHCLLTLLTFFPLASVLLGPLLASL